MKKFKNYCVEPHYTRMSRKELIEKMEKVLTEKRELYYDYENMRTACEYYQVKFGLPYYNDGRVFWSCKRYNHYIPKELMDDSIKDYIYNAPVPSGNYKYKTWIVGINYNYIVFERTYINEKNETITEDYVLDTDRQCSIDYAALKKRLGGN